MILILYNKDSGKIFEMMSGPREDQDRLILRNPEAGICWVEGEWNASWTHVCDNVPYHRPSKMTYTEALQALRKVRGLKLQDSDWTQVPDSPLTPEKKEEWRLYRQALRDFPETCEDPANPEWPTPPI